MSQFPFFRRFVFTLSLMTVAWTLNLYGAADGAAPDKTPENDTLVLANGDVLHGKLVQEAGRDGGVPQQTAGRPDD